MTEEQIERKVERATDYIDRQFMAGIYDQATYDKKMREVSTWADGQYVAASRLAAKQRDEFRRRCRSDGFADSWQTLEAATVHAMRNLGR